MSEMSEWARPFRLHLRDGRTWHGAQFPSGHVAINHPDDDQFTVMDVAITIDDLLAERHPEDPLHGAHVEWPEEAE